MQNKISMETVICQAENGFSFDESVIKLSEACEKKALTEIFGNEFILQFGADFPFCVFRNTAAMFRKISNFFTLFFQSI